MVTSVHTGNSAFDSKDATARLRLPASAPDHHEIRQRLTNLMQSTLNLDDILQIFFEQMQSIVTARGLFYENGGEGLKVQLGSPSPHKINYRLNTDTDMLGEVTFSRRKRFSEAELSNIESLLGSLIFPLRNALKYRSAVQSALRDPLTGTGNRIALDNALAREKSLADRYDQPLSLLTIDIDHFKRINDNFGHSSGDEVLREVARGIVAVTRQTDMTFRFGGEEFVVLLNKTNPEGASVIAERIRHFIEKARVETNNELLQATVSIGVSTLRKDESTKMLFDRADQALYKAKAQGRNQIIAAEA